MEARLQNSFAALSVDCDAEGPEAAPSTSRGSGAESTREANARAKQRKGKGKGGARARGRGAEAAADSDGEDGEAAAAAGDGSERERRLDQPLIWIDLEMTGLDPEVDTILEIACIVTDGSLARCLPLLCTPPRFLPLFTPAPPTPPPPPPLSARGHRGPQHRHPPQRRRPAADERLVQSAPHRQRRAAAATAAVAAAAAAAAPNRPCGGGGGAGLSQRVLESSVSTGEAEEAVLAFVRRYTEPARCQLAGSSVHWDLTFLKRYMPRLAAHFHHRIVDVSSINECVRRWHKKLLPSLPKKRREHTALADIRESIEELRWYKTHVFRR